MAGELRDLGAGSDAGVMRPPLAGAQNVLTDNIDETFVSGKVASPQVRLPRARQVSLLPWCGAPLTSRRALQ